MITYPRREPVVVFMLFACLAGGLAQVIIGGPPNSIASTFDTWFQWIWAGMAIIGSGAALLGLFRKTSFESLVLESLGLLSTGTSTAVYGAGLYFYAGPNGVWPGTISLGLGISLLLRRRNIEKVLRPIRRGK